MEQEENGFHPKPSKWENERWMNDMNQPIFEEKLIEKQFGNQVKKDFLGNQILSIWLEERELKESERYC